MHEANFDLYHYAQGWRLEFATSIKSTLLNPGAVAILKGLRFRILLYLVFLPSIALRFFGGSLILFRRSRRGQIGMF